MDGDKNLVIVGPSGVGKGTLIRKLQEEFPNKFSFSISHTTRNIRQGEVNEKNYYFVTKEVFTKMVEENGFVEHTTYNNNYYGTSKMELERLRTNNSVIYIIYLK